jgi:hypothetical protein
MRRRKPRPSRARSPRRGVELHCIGFGFTESYGALTCILCGTTPSSADQAHLVGFFFAWVSPPLGEPPPTSPAARVHRDVIASADSMAWSYRLAGSAAILDSRRGATPEARTRAGANFAGRHVGIVVLCAGARRRRKPRPRPSCATRSLGRLDGVELPGWRGPRRPPRSESATLRPAFFAQGFFAQKCSLEGHLAGGEVLGPIQRPTRRPETHRSVRDRRNSVRERRT